MKNNYHPKILINCWLIKFPVESVVWLGCAAARSDFAPHLYTAPEAYSVYP